MNERSKFAIRERINKLEADLINVERLQLCERDYHKWGRRINELEDELHDLREDLRLAEQPKQVIGKVS